jgi:hypothetical protein
MPRGGSRDLTRRGIAKMNCFKELAFGNDYFVVVTVFPESRATSPLRIETAWAIS